MGIMGERGWCPPIKSVLVESHARSIAQWRMYKAVDELTGCDGINLQSELELLLADGENKSSQSEEALIAISFAKF